MQLQIIRENNSTEIEFGIVQTGFMGISSAATERMLVPEARRFRAQLDKVIKQAELSNRPLPRRVGDY